MFWFKRKPAQADPPPPHREFALGRRTGIALGSNIGNRIVNLDAGRGAILRLPGVFVPALVSRVFLTEPVGTAPDTHPFLNAVIEVDFKGKPEALLAALRNIETSLGRPEHRPKNASRILDLDILYMDGLVLTHENLTIPHPRLHLRRFVLTPLNDIRPDLVLPGQERPVAELLESLDDPAAVKLFAGKW